MGYGGKDLQKRKVLSLERKSEGVMDDESGELMELMEEVPSLLTRTNSILAVTQTAGPIYKIFYNLS